MKFENLYDQSVSLNEQKVIEKWEKVDLLDLSIKQREDNEKLILYKDHLGCYLLVVLYLLVSFPACQRSQSLSHSQYLLHRM